jgi:hypothetical protein
MLKSRRMKKIVSAFITLTFAMFSAAAFSQSAHRTGGHKGRSNPGKPVANVAKDLPERLARWKTVPMPFRSQGLKPREIQLVDKLVEASRDIEDIYWRQSDPETLTLYESLKGATDPRDQMLRRFLCINGSRFDLLDENQPFVGSQPMPPAHALYPPDLTRAQLDAYVAAHPDKKNEIYNPHTVVRREGQDLVGIPYHVAFVSFLEDAAKKAREAADLSDDPAFAKFLRLRADALLSDDYFQSDLAWLDLANPKFDIIFAPYEVYLDGMLGVKTSYGAAVLVRNQPESKKLELYQKYVPDIQEALPLAKEDLPSKRGLATPMEVMDAPFRAGDLNHGYQAVADNLPNDPRIHEQKGSKKIFFKNFMDARVNYIVLPVAKRVMKPEQASKASANGYLAATILHEISHGLGPAFARVGGKQVDIREAIGPAYSGLEEAKADVVGMFGLQWLMDHQVLPKGRLQEYYASYLAGIFRTVRFGTGEAHGRAEMMEFNYLNERKAITRNAAGKYAVDFSKMPDALASLAKELLEIEASGDRARAENWFKKYDTMPAELKSALAAANSVPVDIEPVFSFSQEPR